MAERVRFLYCSLVEVLRVLAVLVLDVNFTTLTNGARQKKHHKTCSCRHAVTNNRRVNQLVIFVISITLTLYRLFRINPCTCFYCEIMFHRFICVSKLEFLCTFHKHFIYLFARVQLLVTSYVTLGIHRLKP